MELRMIYVNTCLKHVTTYFFVEFVKSELLIHLV